MAATFGLLERITNIREHWPRKDTDFTPLLAVEDKPRIKALSGDIAVLPDENGD